MDAKTTKSNFNKTGTRQIGKAYNPHLKRKDAHLKQKMEESKYIEQDMNINMDKEDDGKKEDGREEVEKTKEDIAKNLLRNGYIDSFVDFFYLGWQKTPSLISAYEKGVEDEKVGEEGQENEENQFDGKADIADEKIERHSLSFDKLKAYKKHLMNSEYFIREASRKEKYSKDKENAASAQKFKDDMGNDIQNAVASYKKISDDTVGLAPIPIEAIYFIEKRINLSKTYNLPGAIINSLIDMGSCFEIIATSKAMNTSKNLKEEAQEVFETNSKGQGEDQTTKTQICTKLMDLYVKLAERQEKMKDYLKAIDLLNDYLKVLEKLIEGKSQDELNTPDYQKYLNDKTTTYLKIADLYYQQENYEKTLETLKNIDELNTINKDKNLSVSYFYINYFIG